MESVPIDDPPHTQHGADVLDVAFRPDGDILAAATLDGQIALWDAREAQQVAFLRRDQGCRWGSCGDREILTLARM